MGLFNLPGSKPKVKYYEGISGLKTAYYNTISHGGPLYGFAEWGKVLKDPAVYEWLWNDFADDRTERKMNFPVAS